MWFISCRINFSPSNFLLNDFVLSNILLNYFASSKMLVKLQFKAIILYFALITVLFFKEKCLSIFKIAGDLKLWNQIPVLPILERLEKESDNMILVYLSKMPNWAFLIKFVHCLSSFHNLCELFISFSRTNRPIFRKLGTKHPWLQKNQILFKWRATSSFKGR